MSLTPSTMLPLGTSAPAFSLPDTNGKTVSIGDFKNAPALLVMFNWLPSSASNAGTPSPSLAEMATP